jgi:hypothetical protein
VLESTQRRLLHLPCEPTPEELRRDGVPGLRQADVVAELGEHRRRSLGRLEHLVD